MSQQFLDKITRDDVQEAMRRFFEKGGKIKKVEGIDNEALSDQFEVEVTSDETNVRDLNFSYLSLE